MSRLQLVIFVVGIVVVIAAVGVTVANKVGLEQAFQAALTAALVYVTAAYVALASQIVKVSKQQAGIMVDEQLNSAAPVIVLEAAHRKGPSKNEVEIEVRWMNIGKGPALNFRCWIEDGEHPELRVRQKAICRTAVEVALSDTVAIGTIHTGILEYTLGVGYVRAQYESVFKKTYESCLLFSENAAPELKYGEATDRVIL